ncbi:MAG TPA: hypothetical protein VFW96_02145, partial [Thermomicrobiales bacterium]|nr:hypothetical protein [Thermomicrobiales bacterium]
MRSRRLTRHFGRLAGLLLALSLLATLVGYAGVGGARAAQDVPGGTADVWPAGGQTALYQHIVADNAGRLHAVWSDVAGTGMIFHALFTPGPGRSPANLSDWAVEKIGDGKNPGVDINPVTGDIWAV